MSHFILATAGHVDHGKSALVQALTGIDPDRLPEEKVRGITIDLGFAHLALPHPHSALRTPRFDVGIVDVPGHEDFVKNMVAGVGSIDLALLVVAADDGWMPQTEEHLQILSYLGVRHGVVALTKADLAGDLAAARAAIRAQLEGSALAHAPIVPTSVINGQGLEELRTALAGVLDTTPPPADLGKARLWADRVFVLKGIGTVATGTLTGGRLRRGQLVEVQPRGHETRIRSLQSHNQEIEEAVPGMRVALNLPDVEPDSGIRRGEVVTLPDLGSAADTWDVWLERSPRLTHGLSPAARELHDETRVNVHLGTTSLPARLVLMNGGSLPPGQSTLAQLRLDSPVFAFAGDRFIVRDASEQSTLAGGLVLDPDANRRGFHRPAHRRFLEGLAQAPTDPAVFVRSELARRQAAARPGLLRKSRFPSGQIADAVAEIVGQGTASLRRDWVVETSWWQALERRIIVAVETQHREHPNQPGLPLNDLKALLADDLRWPEMAGELIEGLAKQGFEQAGAHLRKRDHRPVLPPHLEAAGNRLRATLAANPLDPPSRKELAPDPPSLQALRFLLQTGDAVELGPDVVLSAAAYAAATAKIRRHLEATDSATASELRQLLGTSRRILIPLLERMDREGTTRRDGDRRRLKR